MALTRSKADGGLRAFGLAGGRRIFCFRSDLAYDLACGGATYTLFFRQFKNFALSFCRHFRGRKDIQRRNRQHGLDTVSSVSRLAFIPFSSAHEAVGRAMRPGKLGLKPISEALALGSQSFLRLD